MTPKSLISKLPGYSVGTAWYNRRRAALRLRKKSKAFRQEFEAFEQMSLSTKRAQGFSLRWEDRWPFLEDKTATTEFDRHYVYHTAWAARVLASTMPAKHIDISSSLYFGGIVSAFIPVSFYDYRPANLQLDSFTSAAIDLAKLPFADGSIDSLSCMHVVEHIGLGRYGDALDPVGDLIAMRELQRVLAPGGSLMFVVPVGKSRICFNAHRIYSFHQVRDAFTELELKDFALIPDSSALGGLIHNAPDDLVDSQEYGCGCFWFRCKAQ
jgi:SAM-dependent methyltransferase